jgi:hypothetical protein
MMSLSVDGLIVVLPWGMKTTARLNASFTAAKEPGMQNIFSLILTNWVINVLVLFRRKRKTIRKGKDKEQVSL